MNRFILSALALLLFAIGTVPGFSQCGNGSLQPICSPTIASDAVVVNANDTVMQPNLVCFWVCSGVTLFMNGGANCQVYAEPGATVKILGGENYVWMQGGTLVIETGALSNFVRRTAATNYTDNGSNTLDTVCAVLSYNYGQAPVVGCPPVGTDEAHFQPMLQVFPNPSNGAINLKFQMYKAGRVKVKLLDMRGKTLRIKNFQGQPAGQASLRFDAGDLAAGLYILRVDFPNGTAFKPVRLLD